MEVPSTIYDIKISNLWTTGPCFTTTHSLLVSVFDMVSKPKLSRFTAQYSSCYLQKCHFFRKDKIVQQRKEQVIYFLRATNSRQSGLFMYQITLKAYRMPQSYHSLKSKNILKIFNRYRGKNQEKAGAFYFTIRQKVDLSSINLHTTVIVAAIMFG